MHVFVLVSLVETLGHYLNFCYVPQHFFYRRITTKTCATPMHTFPMSRNPQVDHLNIHQVARGIPLSPQISTARHTSSVLKSLKTQSDKITSKGKLDSLQERRGVNPSPVSIFIIPVLLRWYNLDVSRDLVLYLDLMMFLPLYSLVMN